jgi:hypothetical protein
MSATALGCFFSASLHLLAEAVGLDLTPASLRRAAARCRAALGLGAVHAIADALTRLGVRDTGYLPWKNAYRVGCSAAAASAS